MVGNYGNSESVLLFHGLRLGLREMVDELMLLGCVVGR